MTLTKSCCEKCACKGRLHLSFQEFVGHRDKCHNPSCPCHKSKCDCEALGLECCGLDGHTPQQANYLNVGRAVKCGHCDPQYAEGLKTALANFPDYKCDCVCHDKTKQPNNIAQRMMMSNVLRPKAEQEKENAAKRGVPDRASSVSQPDASWEERFDKRFMAVLVIGYPNSPNMQSSIQMEMKDFIRKVREEAYQEGIEADKKYDATNVFKDGIRTGRRRAGEKLKEIIDEEFILDHNNADYKKGWNAALMELLEAASREEA